jgi:hypothetical protein
MRTCRWNVARRPQIPMKLNQCWSSTSGTALKRHLYKSEQNDRGATPAPQSKKSQPARQGHRASLLPRTSGSPATEPEATPRSANRRNQGEITSPGALLAEMPMPQAAPLATLPLMNTSLEREPNLRVDSQRELTEVHVHIGRVEVVMPSGPRSPSKAQKPAPRQTVPLSEFLARKARP